MTEELPKLNLEELLDGMPGLTTEVASGFVQAATVCLESNSHADGVVFNCGGWKRSNYCLHWPKYPDPDQVTRAWGDLQYATEHGAYGVAILLVRQLANKVVWERSAKGTGFDFWLGDADAEHPPFLFQGTSRLEVSGILNDVNQVAPRVKQKIGQVQQSSALGLDAYVVVVEFGSPQAQVAYQ